MNPRIFGELLALDTEPGKLFSERLVLTHTDFLGIHNRLVAGIDLDVTTTLQTCLAHLDAIAEISAKHDLYGIQQICKELHHYINTSIYGFDEYQLIIRKLVVWIDNILIYLDNQDDFSIIQKLFDPLPQNTSVFLKTIMGLHTDSDHRITVSDDVEDTMELETDFIFSDDNTESEIEDGSSVIAKASSNTEDLPEDEVVEDDLLSLVVAETVVADTAIADTVATETIVDETIVAEPAINDSTDDQDDYLVMGDDGFVADSNLQTEETDAAIIAKDIQIETETPDLLDPTYIDHEHADDYVVIGEDGQLSDSVDKSTESDIDATLVDSELSTNISIAKHNDGSSNDGYDPVYSNDDDFVSGEINADIADDNNPLLPEAEQSDNPTTHLYESYIVDEAQQATVPEVLDEDSNNGSGAILVKSEDDKSLLLPVAADNNDEIDSLLDNNDKDLLLSDNEDRALLSDEQEEPDSTPPSSDSNDSLDPAATNHDKDSILLSVFNYNMLPVEQEEQIDNVTTEIEQISTVAEQEQLDQAEIPEDSLDIESVELLVDSDDNKSILPAAEADDIEEIDSLLDNDEDSFATNKEDDEGLLLTDNENGALLSDDQEEPGTTSPSSENHKLLDPAATHHDKDSILLSVFNYNLLQEEQEEKIDNVITELEQISTVAKQEQLDQAEISEDSIDNESVELLVNPEDDKSMLLAAEADDSDEIDSLLDNDDDSFETIIDDDEGLLLSANEDGALLTDDQEEPGTASPSDEYHNPLDPAAVDHDKNSILQSVLAYNMLPDEQIDNVITNLEQISIAAEEDQLDQDGIPEDKLEDEPVTLLVKPDDDKSMVLSDDDGDILEIDSILEGDEESVAMQAGPDGDEGLLLSDDDDGLPLTNDDDGLLLSDDNDDGLLLSFADDDEDGLLLSDDEDITLQSEDDSWLIAEDDQGSNESDIFESDSENFFTESDSSESDFDFSDDGIFSSDEQPAADDLLGVLNQELMQITPELNKLGNIITSSEDQQVLDHTVETYSELLERVIVATEAMGLLGLHCICEFVINNISLALTMEFPDRRNMSGILGEWPNLVTTYLQNPQNDVSCVSLVDHFQITGWPNPISGEEARDLYVALAEGMSEFEMGETVDPRQTVATSEDVNLVISTDINEELLEAFFIEAPSQAENFSDLISQINDDENLSENVKFAQRIAHTLKGSGNLIGAKGIANLTHHIEDILEYLSQNNMAPPKALCDLLQESADCLELMIEAVQGIGPAPDNALTILQKILDWANRIDQGNIRAEDINNIERGNSSRESSTATVKNESLTSPSATTTDSSSEPTVEKQTHSAPANVEMLRVPVHVIDELLRILGEVSIAISQVQEHNNRLQQRGKKLKLQDTAVQYQRFELENLVDVRSMSGVHRKSNRQNGKDELFDSLEMDQYDELYGTAHRFIETVSDSREISQLIQTGLSTLDGLFLQQQHLNKELQQIVMTTRMITVESISPRLQRTVRQASKATNKKVNLEIIGSKLLIDSNVLNKLVDPLMHMLRNAVDHGIESTQERLDADKHAIGLVTLTFKQIGNNVRIHCADDGRGLDYLRINEKAIAKGIIGEHDVLSNNELSRLILHPGFSTRDTATQTSGRGVGMDVVHATILDLKGTLDIQESEQGGTLFVLDLPISLVTNHSLVVKVDKERFAIPTNSLEQILAPHVGKINHFGESATYHLGKNVYTARSLRSLIGGGNEINTQDIVLIAKVDNGNVAIAVDQVVNSYDLVTKNTGNYVKNVSGISGVTVLGDGSIVPVLDLPELLRTQTASHQGMTPVSHASSTSNQTVNTTNVLIVDDSLSMRKSLTQFVEDIGYHAIQARDGLEATDILKKQHIDIALVDMEMPRMNGIELTTHIRASDKNKNLPIIMITSRTQQKHRQKAEAAGVSQYLAKPYSEDTLINSMELLLPKVI